MFNSPSIIHKYTQENNNFYMLREDLLPYSFGGNKVRKNLNYFEEITTKNYTHVITYGSKSSNHARVVANLSAKYNLRCTIITPESDITISYNTYINEMLEAEIISTPLDKVKYTIEQTLKTSIRHGEKPYFIQGGGHGYLGTKAYVDTFSEINFFSEQNNVKFDCIFLASGTGATQAGLVIGNHLNNYSAQVIGISIARSHLRGLEVIKESIEDYFKTENKEVEKLSIIFNDQYILGGYGKCNEEVEAYINMYFKKFGIPLDKTYTGKAVYGMHKYLERNKIEGKNILFIHTGGTPLYFDYLKERGNEYI